MGDIITSSLNTPSLQRPMYVCLCRSVCRPIDILSFFATVCMRQYMYRCGLIDRVPMFRSNMTQRLIYLRYRMLQILILWICHVFLELYVSIVLLLLTSGTSSVDSGRGSGSDQFSMSSIVWGSGRLFVSGSSRVNTPTRMERTPNRMPGSHGISRACREND